MENKPLCTFCKEDLMKMEGMMMMQKYFVILIASSVSCFSKIRIGFTFLVPAHPGTPGKVPLNGCLCMFVFV